MRQRDVVRAVRPGVVRRLAVMAALSCLFVILLGERLQGLDPRLVLRAMGDVGLVFWIGALGATCLSFTAIAGYDVAIHRHLGTGIASDRAGWAGFAAIAIGQTVGMGVLSGALVRWRMLPELGLSGAVRISIMVAVSFLLAWAFLCAGVISLSSAVPFAGAVAGFVALVATAMVVALFWRGRAIPNLITLGTLMLCATADCLGAGLALWLVTPVDMAFAPFLAAFLLALGAGLVSGSPAGVGAFEIVLLALSPEAQATDVLAGIVGWRVLYYAAPAVAGAIVAVMARHGADAGSTGQRAPPCIAEGGLVRQGALFAHPAGFVAGRTRHGLVALADVADLTTFRLAAQAVARWPVLYKASGRVACRARAAGMRVLPVALEAWLVPQDFRLECPSRSGLRRKLRKAAAAGVVAGREHQPDWEALARVNAA